MSGTDTRLLRLRISRNILPRAGKRLLAGMAALVCLLAFLPVSPASAASYVKIEINGLTYLLSNHENFYNPQSIRIQADSLYKSLEPYPEIQTYVYLVNSSRTVDVKKDVSAVPKTYTKIQEYFTKSQTDYLRMNSLEDYASYFYTTDHHWNYCGSYVGYKQIVAMMFGEDEPVLEPVETVTFPIKFNGSMNQTLHQKNSQEDFTVYRFDYPEIKVELNGRPKPSYGNQQAYFDGNYPKAPLSNHYNNFYGGEFALVHLETDRTDRGNLLMFSNSMSDALDLLLASHFHHAWIVDPRHYERSLGKPFSMKTAVEEWQINQVLILGDGMYFEQPYHYR